MKSNQQVNHRSVLIRRLTIVTLLSVTLCVCAILMFTNLQPFRLSANQRRWELSEPSAYYMQVVEDRSYGGLWHWEAYVEDSHPMTVTMLYAGDQNLESWLDPANVTVEQIFSLADRSCANRGILNCGLEFDPRFHYPRRVVSYETIIIEIKKFVPCETVADCAPEPELSP